MSEEKTKGVRVHVTKPDQDPVDETAKTAPDAAEKTEDVVQETASKGSTDDASSDTVASDAEPALVHETTAIGGRFVSLGGGERMWVKGE